MPGVSDSRWAAQGTTPGAIEAALREMLKERHAENESFVARARAEHGLRRRQGVERRGRQPPAQRRALPRLAHDRARGRAQARRGSTRWPTIASDVQPKAGEFALLRETVIVDVGEQAPRALDTIVDPLVVTDLPTVLWSPHGHPEAVDVAAAARPGRAARLGRRARPRRGARARARAAARRPTSSTSRGCARRPGASASRRPSTPPHLRPDLRHDQRGHGPPPPRVGGRRACCSSAGWPRAWAGSRRSSSPRNGDAGGQGPRASARTSTLAPRARAATCSVRGLAGLTLETASGRHLELDRGPGGLRARYRNRKGDEREWTVLGASRGEAGILGEGIRQALLRDPTYGPALDAANALAP